MRLVTTTTTSPAPPAVPAARDASEQAIVDGFRADRMIEQVRGLGGPRVAGTADAKRAAELIRATAEANGWQAHIEHVPASRATRGKDLYNVVAERRGTAPDGERGLVLAGAHFDTVAGAYGANDDGSGTAALLEGTRVFTQVPTRHDLRFVWFDGEEDGLLGSRAYAAKHADALAGAKAIVVAEMLGSPGGAPKLVFTDRASGDAARRVTDAAARNGLRPQVVVDPMAGSDHLPFARLGIPAFVVASAAPGTMRRDDPNYHRPSDTPDKLNAAVFEASGDLFGLAVNSYANAAT
jgi:aminopeptidase YwaD